MKAYASAAALRSRRVSPRLSPLQKLPTFASSPITWSRKLCIL